MASRHYQEVAVRRAGWLAAVVVLCAMPRQADACTCAQLTLCPSLANAGAVFVARAEVVSSSRDTQRTRLHIETVYKGTVPKMVEVLSVGIGGSCDYAFASGARHLVYATRGADRAWKLSSCSRTATVDHAREDIAFLNDMREKRVNCGATARATAGR